ncbi:protein FAM174C [Centroberyx gerrardi]
MTFQRVFPAVILPICWVFVTMADDASKAASTAAPKPLPTNPGVSVNSTNSTHPVRDSHGGLFKGLNVDSSMIQRALYVLIGITMIGVLYFLVRAVRLKKPSQKKKYGLLSNYDDTVELEALESDEDETLYEARSLRR